MDNYLLTTTTKQNDKYYRLSVTSINIDMARHEAVEDKRAVWFDGGFKFQFSVLYEDKEIESDRLP